MNLPNDVTRCHGYTVGITPIRCVRREKCLRYLQLERDKGTGRLTSQTAYLCGPGEDYFISPNGPRGTE